MYPNYPSRSFESVPISSSDLDLVWESATTPTRIVENRTVSLENRSECSTVLSFGKVYLMLYLNLLRARVDLVAELPMEFLRVDTFQCVDCG